MFYSCFLPDADLYLGAPEYQISLEWEDRDGLAKDYELELFRIENKSINRE